MSFKRENGRVTISAEMSEDELREFVFASGRVMVSAFEQQPELGWLYISIMNRFMEGDPSFHQYEIPADRSSEPFRMKPIQVAELPEPAKQ
jgi:hypothetical protein